MLWDPSWGWELLSCSSGSQEDCSCPGETCGLDPGAVLEGGRGSAHSATALGTDVALCLK